MAAIGRQAAECHNVQTALIFRKVYSTTNGAHHYVIVIGQLRQLAGLQNIFIELVIIANRKDDLIKAA